MLSQSWPSQQLAMRQLCYACPNVFKMSKIAQDCPWRLKKSAGRMIDLAGSGL